MLRNLLPAALLLSFVPATAQTPAATSTPAATPPALQTHQINADGSITFRYKNAGATKVELRTDAPVSTTKMVRGADGVWSVTTKPAPPEIYGYGFSVDGTAILDPRNNDVRHNLLAATSEVTVPAVPPAPWELTDIPHGRVATYLMTTHVAQHLPADQEEYLVYTPPHYDARHHAGYPVLYLLHGWSDSADGWVGVGRANLILDSLIAQGKAVPMIVVMPAGYGDYDFVKNSHNAWQDHSRPSANTQLFTQMLLTEIMPAVERDYAVAPGRNNRAIAGLSMGGLESLSVGLNNTEKFAYVGGFSAVASKDALDDKLATLTQEKANLKLLWVACGESDGLYPQNQRFTAWAKTQGLPVTAVVTPGAHTWVVWRDNLLHFAPLLFQKQ
jgi:enterochelin esterase family protein